MTRAATDVAAAVRRVDRAFAGVISRHGAPPAPRPIRVDRRFSVLATAILHQQLAGAAARAIHGRVCALVGDPMTPAAVLAASEIALGECGVSGPKRRSLFDLAERSLDGTIDFAALSRRSDDEVVEVLSTVRGIGVWTAQMFCLSALGRRDVWPTGDLGVRMGWTLLHGGGETIAPRDLAALGEEFRPHRSAVAWYCWRAVEDARAERARG